MKKRISLYPNPTTGMVYLRDMEETDGLHYQLTDLYGRTVEVSSFEQNGIDISGKRPGVYFIRIFKDNKLITTEKIIKQ